MKPTLTVEQVAEILQVRPDTVYPLIHSGQIEASNVASGRKRIWRIRPEAVDAFLDLRRKVVPVAPANSLKGRNRMRPGVEKFY